MNPINIFQMMKAGPKQFIQQMMGNNQMMSNPIMKNALGMVQSGNMKGVEQMARNLCKEKGLNADEVFNQVKGKFGNQ
jgi:hypothetical protein